MEGIEYYICQIRLDDREHTVLWYAGDPDGVYCQRPDSPSIFASEDDARRFCGKFGLRICDDESTYYDLDRCLAWCDNLEIDRPHPTKLLGDWNILADLLPEHRRSEALRALEHTCSGLYEKIFWTSNVMANLTGTQQQSATWTPAELKQTANYFTRAIAELREFWQTTKP